MASPFWPQKKNSKVYFLHYKGFVNWLGKCGIKISTQDIGSKTPCSSHGLVIMCGRLEKDTLFTQCPLPPHRVNMGTKERLGISDKMWREEGEGEREKSKGPASHSRGVEKLLCCFFRKRDYDLTLPAGSYVVFFFWMEGRIVREFSKKTIAPASWQKFKTKTAFYVCKSLLYANSCTHWILVRDSSTVRRLWVWAC